MHFSSSNIDQSLHFFIPCSLFSYTFTYHLLRSIHQAMAQKKRTSVTAYTKDPFSGAPGTSLQTFS